MTDFHIEKITDRCAEFGVKIDREITERLNLYGNLLLEWNEKINLTAITAPEDVLYKHFYDCILFFKAVTPDKNAEIIDVGTGAGFPGMVLKIIRPDLKITLLDSLNKRLLFLNEVISQLGLHFHGAYARRGCGQGARAPRKIRYCLCARSSLASGTYGILPAACKKGRQLYCYEGRLRRGGKGFKP